MHTPYPNAYLLPMIVSCIVLEVCNVIRRSGCDRHDFNQKRASLFRVGWSDIRPWQQPHLPIHHQSTRLQAPRKPFGIAVQ